LFDVCGKPGQSPRVGGGLTMLLLDVYLSPFITHWVEKRFSTPCQLFHHLKWQTLSDKEAFMKAKEMNAVVLTNDEDFVALVRILQAPPKVIWLTCGDTSHKRLKEIFVLRLQQAIELRNTNDLVEISD